MLSGSPCSSLRLSLTLESERVPSEAPSSLPSLTASPSAASQCCVVTKFYGIAEYCLAVLRCCRTLRYRRVLLPIGASSPSTSACPSSAPSGSPSSTPVSVRTGTLSCSRSSFLRLSLPAETERGPSEAPSSLSSVTASLSAASLPRFTVSPSTASQCSVVAELYSIGEFCFLVVRRAQARALVPALRRVRLQHWCELDCSAALPAPL
jgi:hypothetical protein